MFLCNYLFEVHKPGQRAKRNNLVRGQNRSWNEASSTGTTQKYSHNRITVKAIFALRCKIAPAHGNTDHIMTTSNFAISRSPHTPDVHASRETRKTKPTASTRGLCGTERDKDKELRAIYFKHLFQAEERSRKKFVVSSYHEESLRRKTRQRFASHKVSVPERRTPSMNRESMWE